MIAKNHVLILFLILPLPHLALCQNLVLNPSFECGTDECYPITSGPQFYLRACNWTSATGATPDVFSTQISDPTCYLSMPLVEDGEYLHIGSQTPHTGNRFAGIITYYVQPGIVGEYHEFIEAKLSEPLVPGEYYCMEMWVSRASRAGYSCNNLGMYFSDTLVYQNNVGLLPFTPQVLAANVIVDQNWIKISETFQATSPAQYVIIGNFFTEPQTTAVFTSTGYIYESESYYFIDDVSVQKIPSDLTFTGLTAICQGEFADITLDQNLQNISWAELQNPNQIVATGNELHVNPAKTTTYQIVGDMCGVIVRDTVSIHVHPLPKINWSKDTTVCKGNTLILKAGTGFSSYQWQDNSTNNDFAVTKPGDYSVTVTDQFGCSNNTSINVDYLSPPKVDLGKDTLECAPFVPLNAGNRKSTYVWSSGSTDSTFIPRSSGKYWVTVTNQCGHLSDTIQIYSMDNLFVPNVVTFNHDGRNDNFRFTGVGDALASLKIINRWGEMIFYDNEYRDSWPSPNQDITAGTYYYTMELPGCPPTKGWIQVFK
jgi:hypothetical protein